MPGNIPITLPDIMSREYYGNIREYSLLAGLHLTRLEAKYPIGPNFHSKLCKCTHYSKYEKNTSEATACSWKVHQPLPTTMKKGAWSQGHEGNVCTRTVNKRCGDPHTVDRVALQAISRYEHSGRGRAQERPRHHTPQAGNANPTQAPPGSREKRGKVRGTERPWARGRPGEKSEASDAGGGP